VTEDAAADPRNVYAATKLHQEHLCAAWGRESGAAMVALRYHNVYGPRMPRDTPYAGVVSIFASAIAGGRAPEVFEDGGQLRDFVHVRDVARANVLALLADRVPAGPYNIASGTPRTVSDVAMALWRAAGTNRPAPEVSGRWRLGDVRHVVASADKARTTLGFTSEVPFEAGMAEFAAEEAALSRTP
jgi:dTDP-L-rhamnose 4-epimerase